jgi:hypothetical protein
LSRSALHPFAAALLAFAGAAALRAQPALDEAGVRASLAGCVEAWNRHQPRGFGEVCLTDDVWFSEADDSIYKRFQGREKVLGAFGYNIESADLQWEVVRLKALPDGTVAAELNQRIGILPRKPDGRYAQTFDSQPSFARLRRDGGAWKVYFFTSHRGWARALLQELDKPAAPAVAAAAKTPAVVADPRVPPGAEPAAYSVQLGTWGGSCFHCHGRRPALTEDGDRGRIVASGAAAQSAGELRRAMTTPRAGGIMDDILADPALTDERLDAIRLWLRAMRDGRAERLAGRIVIHNPRSERDPPARLALLRAEGGWRLPQGAGCRQGAALKGGTQCEIRVPPGDGTLVFRFAPSPGLKPEEVRLALREAR